MCGIAGEFNFTSTPSQADWDNIGSLMVRRGPDDAGSWADNPHCTFVFRRLSILDLSENGHQPMLDASGRYAIIFNGEVYNFADLRNELIAEGFKFRSHGDTEVVLYSLIKWGAKALCKFNGMFALAFYDSVKKRLLLARDHAGIKPLYYVRVRQGIAFASQYDQLLAHPFSQSSKISEEALALYIRLAFIPAPYTILQDTHMLEPGTWVEFSKEGTTETGTYYNFPTYRKPSLRGDEAIEAVDAAITAAVKRQMVSDVPVGGFLSGGIDSPLVMAKMRSSTSGIIHAFTLGTDGDATDESQEAIRYAKAIDVSQTVENFTPDQALSMIEDVVQACGEPFGDYSIFPTMLISMVASRNFKVMLSGDGGDELFWGYPVRAANIIQYANAFRMPFVERKIRWGFKRFFNLGNAHHFSRLKTLGHLQRRFHTHLPEDRIKRIFPTLRDWPISYDKFDFDGWERDRTAQWHRCNEFISHLTMVLLKVDRASMHHSLEVRVPLLDREVIDVASNVDWRTCLDLDRKIGKIPLRRVLSRHVDYQTEQKRGFAIPMGQWLRTSLRDMFDEKVVKRDNVLGLEINQKAMHELFFDHASGKADYGWGLWPLLSLALWSDRNFRDSSSF